MVNLTPELEQAPAQTVADPAIVDPRARIAGWLDRPVLAALDWEKVLYLAIFVVAVLTRFWDLGARVMSHDESLHTYFSFNLATGKGFSHTPLMHGPFLFHITALSYFLFGADDFTSRIPTALFGIGLVILPYLFRRQLGRIGALVTSVALLISPSVLYHARYIRQEAFVLVWVALTVLCIWRFLETRRQGWLVALAAVLAFHATDKSTSFLTVAWVMVFIGLTTLRELYLLRGRARNILTAVAYVGFLSLAMLIVCIALELLARLLTQVLNLGDMVTQVEPVVLSINFQWVVFAGVVVLAGLAFAALLAALIRLWFGDWLRRVTAGAPSFSVAVVMVTTTLFMAAPALLLILNPLWLRVSGEELVAVSLLGSMSNLSTNTQVITTMLAMTVAMSAVSVAIGVTWNWRLWLPVVAIFGVITVTLFTTVFTNVAGVGTGFVGQLGYWMAQQSVQRGSQPWYYYLLLVPLYEYLVLAGAACAFIYMAVRGLAGLARWSRDSQELEVRSRESGVRSQEPEVGSQESEASHEPSAVTASQLPPGDETASEVPQSKIHNPQSKIAHLLSSITLDHLWPVLLGWWAISSLVIFSLAGEKMPWLTVHIALPLAFLTGWFVDRLIRHAPARETPMSPTGILATLALAGLTTLLIVRLLALVGGLNIPDGDQAKLLGWIGVFGLTIVMLIVVVLALWVVARRWAGRAIVLVTLALGAILTVRTAYMVTYINYDYAREFLFYAHGAPGAKLALAQLEDLSKRLEGGDGLKIGYDSESSWPMSWYMRLFPNARFIGNELPADYLDLDAIMISDQHPKRNEVEPQLQDNYTQYHYTLVWWPMQDYFDLTWDRISYSLFNPEARAALWDIVFNRDFTRYSAVFDKPTLTPDTWAPAPRFTLYVRNDVAAQVWDYRAGDIATGSETTAGALAPMMRLQGPTGVAVGPDGQRFVIDHKANRVFRLNTDNTVQSNWGGFGGSEGKFNDAWGIAVNSDGETYVADTFNHRIQKFDRDGNFLFSWGRPGVSAEDGDGRSTIFFGPRAIVIDGQDRLLVSDTGNKRVQVFDREGVFLAQFGREGSANGEFSEPVGLAVDANGNIYVADTWNKRIQVFDTSYQFVRAWTVTDWESMDPALLQSVDHKPFLAISGSTLYVSSPRTSQILAYTLSGEPVSTELTMPEGSLPTGLAVDGDSLLVTDANTGQIMQFRLDAGIQ